MFEEFKLTDDQTSTGEASQTSETGPEDEVQKCGCGAPAKEGSDKCEYCEPESSSAPDEERTSEEA